MNRQSSVQEFSPIYAFIVVFFVYVCVRMCVVSSFHISVLFHLVVEISPSSFYSFILCYCTVYHDNFL